MRNDAHDGLAFIPWYPRDWRASTARAMLMGCPTAAYCYRELLDALWLEPTCSLPDDNSVLASLVGISLRSWMRVRHRVLAHLPKSEDGRRRHPRVTYEWEKCLGLREAKRAGAVKTNAKRWGSESHSDQTAYRRKIAQRSPPTPTPTPTPSEDTTTKGFQPSTDPERTPGGREDADLRDKVVDLLHDCAGGSRDACEKAVAEAIAAGLPMDFLRNRAVENGPDEGSSVFDWKREAVSAYDDTHGGPKKAKSTWTPRYEDHSPKAPNSNGAVLAHIASRDADSAALEAAWTEWSARPENAGKGQPEWRRERLAGLAVRPIDKIG